ncbi:ABC transporter permease [Modestobacter altitudinis]|uniref:ABC transporter permease n=1 Tax=Modestobacter altitudinis TaxID=2213158 RepID=UPI001C553E86|nr:ABC transporter permease [Modestobacter altitudinis]
MWSRRRALGLLVSRDLKVRYAGSWLGWVWTVLEPLLMAGAYWVVFTQIFSRSAGEEPYIVFLLAALLPWTWFNGGLSEAARALRTDGKLIRSTNVPRELWVLRVVLAKGVEFLFSLPVLALFAVVTGADVNWRIVLVLPATLLLATLLTGIGFLLAPLVVLVRDLERIVRIVLRLAFYASPVVYAVRDVPQAWEWLFTLNPLVGIFELFRAGFFPELLDPSRVALSVGVSVAMLVLGWAVFARLERTVLKEL